MVTTTVSGAVEQYMVAVRLCLVLSDSTWWQYACVRCCRTVYDGSMSVSGAVGQHMVTTSVSGSVGQYMVAYVCVRCYRTVRGGSTSVFGAVGQYMVTRLCPVQLDSTW